MAQPVVAAVLFAATGLTPVEAESPNAERIADLGDQVWGGFELAIAGRQEVQREVRGRAAEPVAGGLRRRTTSGLEARRGRKRRREAHVCHWAEEPRPVSNRNGKSASGSSAIARG